jgi:hypothetical protein
MLLAVLALALPAAAGAQQVPTLGAPTETQAPVVTTSSNPADRGLRGWQELLIFGAGIVLLLGIGWAIVGDARQRAPVKDRSRRSEEAVDGPRLSPQERRRRKERARAKARAARRARRHNR